MRSEPALTDAYNRHISYVRISVTDRCDLRCTYCMSERQTFLPRENLLSFEELERLCLFLIEQGVTRLRITGGEPLVRRGILDFLKRLGTQVHKGHLKELTLTTNGTLLAEAAPHLVAAGIRRINVSLDSLDADTFRRITRGGDLKKVLDGVAAAQKVGLKVKLNTVALQQDNRHSLPEMIRFAHANGMDISLIETMPLGEEISGREDQFVSLRDVMADLQRFWDITPLSDTTGGPSRYYHVAETAGRLGLITPLSHNFCDTCNRVRITCTGQLYMCLGQDDHVDLRAALREDTSNAALSAAMSEALRHKPKAHDFFIGGQAPPTAYTPRRTMSVTGG